MGERMRSMSYDKKFKKITLKKLINFFLKKKSLEGVRPYAARNGILSMSKKMERVQLVQIRRVKWYFYTKKTIKKVKRLFYPSYFCLTGPSPF